MARFRRSYQTPLNAQGYGAIHIAPTGGKDWRIEYLSIKVSDASKEAKFTIYDRYVGDEFLMESSLTGSSGDTTDTVIQLPDGNSIMCEWVGGVANAVATVSITGDEF